VRRFFTVAVLACAVAFLSTGLAVRAEGTVYIQRADGSSNTYTGVRIAIIANKLHITSSDGKGTLVIERAACSHQGEILVCLPTLITNHQNGEDRPFNLKYGTIYANLTSDYQQLSYSSQHLAPNGVMISLVTANSTHVNITGTIDSGSLTK
jgi:hypothetical protein